MMTYQIGQKIKATGGRLGTQVIEVEIYEVSNATLGVHYERSTKFGPSYGNARVRLDGRGAHVVAA